MADNKLYTKDSIESLSPLERGHNVCGASTHYKKSSIKNFKK